MENKRALRNGTVNHQNEDEGTLNIWNGNINGNINGTINHQKQPGDEINGTINHQKQPGDEINGTINHQKQPGDEINGTINCTANGTIKKIVGGSGMYRRVAEAINH